MPTPNVHLLYMAGGHLPPALVALYTEILAQSADCHLGREVFCFNRQVIDSSAFPAKSLGLRQAEMSQQAIGELAGHLI